MKREAAKRNKKLAAMIVEDAKRNCPVSDNSEPGHVHTVDTIEAKPKGDGSEIAVGAAGAIVFIEYGTSRRAARPVLRPAAARARGEAEKMFRKLL